MTEEQQRLFGLERINVPRADIPAVTHIDYSARVQTVDGRFNPRYNRLIMSFKEKTGYGVLINISFNVRGEPIVCSPQDAYLRLIRTEVDVLVFGNMLLNKQDQPPLVQEKTGGRYMNLTEAAVKAKTTGSSYESTGCL